MAWAGEDTFGSPECFFFFGAIACAVSPSVHLLLVARFVLGLAVGSASVVVPTYLTEMAPAAIRGRIVTQNEVMIVGGQLLAGTTREFGDGCLQWPRFPRWPCGLAC
ncbi:MAG: MFS transporter [Steroidobacteraceae bacterium]